MNESLTYTRRIFLNFGSLTTGKVAGDLFSFLLFVILSRTFGKHGIGQYSFAMAMTGFFAVASDYGLYHVTIKELNQRAGSFQEYYGKIFSLRITLSIIIFGILSVLLLFLPFDTETRVIIAVIGAYQVLCRMVEGIGATFIAHEDMHLAGLLEASLKAAIAIASISVALASRDLIISLAAFPTLAFVFLLASYAFLNKKYGRPRLAFSFSPLLLLLRNSTPYALSVFLFQLYSRTDVVLLGFFLGSVPVGIYNVADRVIFLTMFIPQFAAIALFPLASRLYLNSRKDLQRLYNRSLNLFILIGPPAAAGLWLIAPHLIITIFGGGFADSALILRLLSPLLFLGFLNRIMGMFLMSSDLQILRIKSQWKAALVNFVANLILIPTIGLIGAAVSALLSETLLVTLFAFHLKSKLGPPRIGLRLAISSVGTACFCASFAFSPFLSPGILIPMSAFLYTIFVISFKQVRENEIRTFLNLFKRDIKAII